MTKSLLSMLCGYLSGWGNGVTSFLGQATCGVTVLPAGTTHHPTVPSWKMEGSGPVEKQSMSPACTFFLSRAPILSPSSVLPSSPSIGGILVRSGRGMTFPGPPSVAWLGVRSVGPRSPSIWWGVSNKNSSVTLFKYPGLLPSFLLPLPLCSNCLLNDPHSWLDVVPSTSPVSEVLWNCTLV